MPHTNPNKQKATTLPTFPANISNPETNPEINKTLSFIAENQTNYYLSQFKPKPPEKNSTPLSTTSLILASFAFLLWTGMWKDFFNILTVLVQLFVSPIAIIFAFVARKKEPHADKGIWRSGLILALLTFISLAIMLTFFIIRDLRITF